MGRDWAGMGRIGSDTVLIFGCLVLRAHFQGRQHSTPGCFPKGFPGDVVASIRRKGCLYPEKACWYGQGDFFWVVWMLFLQSRVYCLKRRRT